MKVIVAGGTGFIGRTLVADLRARGHSVDVLTRATRPDAEGVRYLTWGPGCPGAWRAAIAGADAVVNLAGENIAQRWGAAVKRRILDSRVGATRDVVAALREAARRPAVLVNASAVGYYGPGNEAVVEENAAGSDFLAGVCRDWEQEARKAEALGVRVVRLRTGIVLGKGGGALAKMLLPFKLGLGGPLGSGEQWMSWVHLDDVCGLVRFALERPELAGALNAVSPDPRTNAEFTQALGRAVHRPAFLPAPAFALRLLLGEMAGMLLSGQKVLPEKALQSGYRFKHPALSEALAACVD